MQILLLGASGRTGKLVTQLALEKGFQVRVIIRDRKKFPLQGSNLEIIEGSVTDRFVLEKAMTNCTVVLSALNISRKNDFPWAPLRTPKDFLSSVMKMIIELAPKKGIRRIVFTSAWGVGDTKKDIPGWFRWFIDNSNIKYPYQDHERQESLLLHTDLDWTAVRSVGLTSFRKKKNTQVSLNNSPRPTLTITRIAVAEFMLELVEKGSYIRERPVVSAGIGNRESSIVNRESSILNRES